MKVFYILFSITICISPLFAELPAIYPPYLEKGDLIAIVLPASSPDTDEKTARKLLDSKAAWLQKQGYRTVFYPEKIERTGYLAGTDEQRATALMNAWRDENVKAIWCFQGGHGSWRILDTLDYEFIQAHPKIFIGMSDITALHIALQQKTGLVTFLAPVLKFFDDPKTDFDDEYAWNSLEKLISAPIQGAIEMPSDFTMDILRPGTAKGKLVGGNLSLIAALCGTECQLESDGKILVIEDVGEEIQWIDRKLWQLQSAGLLEKPAAVILASWVNCNPRYKYNSTLEEVLNHYFENAPYPVIRGFPTGHDKYQTALPLNGICELDGVNFRIYSEGL